MAQTRLDQTRSNEQTHFDREKTGIIVRNVKRFITTEGNNGDEEENPLGIEYPRGVFTSYCRFVFEGDIPRILAVVIHHMRDPGLIWVREEEVRAEREGDTEIVLDTPALRDLVLKAFATRGSS